MEMTNKALMYNSTLFFLLPVRNSKIHDLILIKVMTGIALSQVLELTDSILAKLTSLT